MIVILESPDQGLDGWFTDITQCERGPPPDTKIRVPYRLDQAIHVHATRTVDVVCFFVVNQAVRNQLFTSIPFRSSLFLNSCTVTGAPLQANPVIILQIHHAGL
jgi:hypothetical protein